MIAAAWVLLLQLGRIMATGSAPIEEGDRARARQEALAAALEQAVSQAAQSEGLSYQAVKAQATSLKGRIDRLRRFVPTYRVLREQEMPGGAFELALEAQVDMPLLRKSLATPQVADAKGPDKNVSRRVILVAPELLLERMAGLLAAHIEIIERVPTGTSKQATPAETSPADWVGQAKAKGAGGVILARVSQAAVGTVRGTPYVAAEVALQVDWWSDQGTPLGHGSAKRRVFLHKDEADSVTPGRTPEGDVLTLLSEATRPLIALLDRQHHMPTVRLHAAGLSGMGQVESLMQILLGMPGVISVEPRRFGEGLVVLDLRGRADAAQFAEALKKIHGIEVQGRADADVRIRVDSLPSTVPTGAPSSGLAAPVGSAAGTP